LTAIALVTGASRGIGRAIALGLADDGYDVAITARTVREGDNKDGLSGSLETTAHAIEGKGRRVLSIPLDLLDRQSLIPAVERVLEEWGAIDVLVNNAILVGSAGEGRFLEADLDELEQRIFANLTAQLVITQRVLKAMLERGRGTVVNVTSTAAVSNPPVPVGEGGWAMGYAVSKGGFHRAAGVIATELGPHGIRCYNVDPGMIATERAKADPRLEFMAEGGRPPEVVADAVRYLLSAPDGTIRNGRTLRVSEFHP
jgi:NAD(P)-dependent dehydrogenase (short-subunit alcohol dehydrogenase family)